MSLYNLSCSNGEMALITFLKKQNERVYPSSSSRPVDVYHQVDGSRRFLALTFTPALIPG